MDTKIYKNLNKAIGNFGQLKLHVAYSLGGMNYFTGNINRRGVYLHINPVNVTKSAYGSSEESILMGTGRESGYKILLEELKRKSQKKIEEQFLKIKEVSDKIVQLYVDEKDSEIFQLVRG